MPVSSQGALGKCENINLPAMLHGVKDLCSVTWENLPSQAHHHMLGENIPLY